MDWGYGPKVPRLCQHFLGHINAAYFLDVLSNEVNEVKEEK
jgi:peptide deformylase